jgi:pimeloyl-ACP methyl ester carboxylesterase
MRSANRVSWYRCFSATTFLAAILTLTAGAVPTRADLFIFKDGTVIEGRVKRQMTLEFDQVARDAYYMPHGFFFLDDGPRRIFFCPSQIGRILEKDPPTEEKISRKDPLPGQVRPMKFPGLFGVANPKTEWNDTWSRRYVFFTRNSTGRIVDLNVPQHINYMTPYWAEVQSRGRFFWGCAYLTRELGPETVQSLLASHPDFQNSKNMPPEKRASLRLRKADFFAQAGFLNLAEKELNHLLSDLPDQKERVETARKTLTKLRAIDRIEEIKRRHFAGQHRRVRKMLEDFPTKDVPEKQIAQVEELEHEYKEKDSLIKETARLLQQAREEIQEADNALLREAADVIRGELDFENVSRLDAFLGQARQVERLRKSGKKPEVRAEQLLSLAVSGWLLGSASAEMSVETGRRLWRGRDMVLSYLQIQAEDKRKQIIQKHQAGTRTESASLDELIQIIHKLPPVAAEQKLPKGVAEYKTEGATYSVQLPPEYRHSRPYPVLIVLHQAGEKPSDMIQRWSDAAAENGYILLSPEWQSVNQDKYTYSEAEHASVVNALRDLRRRFNTDEDRVFLFGLGEGGAMAFDVGLGHPDLFAGVLPMGSPPQYHAELCWRNAQYLPFYVVYGSQGPEHEKLKDLFNNWVILRAYPQLWIDYKGRGVEWFAGEVPNMFDWMGNQWRGSHGPDHKFPLRKLGSSGHGGQFGNEFCTLRACDNHFYWLSSDDIRNTKDLDNWKARLRTPPAALTARIDIGTEDNRIYVDTSGVGRVTIWLGRNNKGEDMIDFDKPVTVQHGLSLMRPWVKSKITPSLEVLLEDLAQRGDRQQLFLAKITIRLLKQK